MDTMKKRDRRQLQEAFLHVKKDVGELNKRLEGFEGDILKTIRRNLQELKDKLADGSITANDYDQRAKRILHWDYS